MKFYNLHQHSHYSVLDGLSKIDKAIDYCKDKKLKALAFTEHGTLSSAYELWDKCNKADIKPILGLEAYFVDDVNDEEGIVPYSYSHMVLLCKNEKGWKNLKQLQLLAWRDGFNKKPRIDYSMLKKHHEGLICSTACIGGLVGSIVLQRKYYQLLDKKDRIKALDKRVKTFKRLFGKDFYFELMFNDMEEQIKVNKKVLKLSKKYKVPMILTNDSHYVYKEDCDLHDVIKCVQFRKELTDENNGTYSIHDLYFVNQKRLLKFRNKDHQYVTEKQVLKCISNSKKIAESIKKFPIRTKKSALPKISDNSKKDLKKLCVNGRKLLIGKSWNTEYNERLEYELAVINKLGMADYFLIVWDIAQEARRRNIPFNTRGSVAGSLVAFLIGISWVDPIRFGTNFERFLTEDRLSLPDIDMDFGKQRRAELIDYLREKYGKECVAHIVNFSKFKPRGAIKDVSRVYGISFGEANKITKFIPDSAKEWSDIPDVKELNDFLSKNEDIAEHSEELQGVIRHRGIHASGVVLTPGDITKWTPVAWSLIGDEDMKDKVTEFDMYALEDMNILKLDFLGQNTLDVIQHTLNIINSDMKTFDDLMKVILNDLDNKKVYKYICTGQLIGTFQMGTSEGMRTLIKEVKPRNIFDIIICIALYRTAILTIGAHTKYIKRRFGREDVEYLHPKMADVLSKTQGIMLFQESPMALAVHLAGFTPTESDHFRKGIKLKDKKKFQAWQKKFINGCKKCSNIDKETAKKIWHEIEVWSGYGFNEAHATSYGVIAYITAWLKYYYPSEFMTALLSHNIEDDDKLNIYIKESKRMGLKLVKPSINNSEDNFIFKNGKILYPLGVVKNAGEKAITDILKVRKNKKFKSLKDFYERINKRVTNVRVVQNLLFAGCFRKFGKVDKLYNEFTDLRPSDNTIRAIFCHECKYKYPVSFTKRQVEESGAVCPECGSPNIVSEAKLIRKKKFNMNYCRNIVFGFTMDSPMKPYLGDLINHGTVDMKELEDCDGETLKIGAMVSGIKKHIDKKGNEMAFVRLTDGENTTDLIVFASIWEDWCELLKKGSVYIFRGKVDGGKMILGNGQSIIKLIAKKI